MEVVTGVFRTIFGQFSSDIRSIFERSSTIFGRRWTIYDDFRQFFRSNPVTKMDVVTGVFRPIFGQFLNDARWDGMEFTLWLPCLAWGAKQTSPSRFSNIVF